MNRNCFLVFTTCSVVLFSFPSFAEGKGAADGPRFPSGFEAAEKPALDKVEKQKIEALLKHLENLKEATFVRNDTALPPKEAAALMRQKWESMGDNIKTASEFIDKLMTVSSSGAKKPYLIRFKDGKETKCAELLKTELKKIESAPKEKEKEKP